MPSNNRRVLQEKNTNKTVPPVRRRAAVKTRMKSWKIANAIEIFSELPEKSKNQVKNWPETAFFKTILRNVMGEDVPEAVTKAVEMGNRRENRLSCGCREGTDCASNPSCRCRTVAHEMAASYKADVLKYGEPINPDLEDLYWYKMMVACSDHCSCKGKCSQNGIQDLEKEQDDKFIIKRTDSKGFCLYTKVDIAKGHPVIFFNGEITGRSAIDVGSVEEEYSLKIIEKEIVITEFLKDKSLANGPYLKALKKAYYGHVWLNPLQQGNAARFLSHGCKPNLVLGRVFQGGFSPADFRVVMFSTQDIAAGTELTFDYGKDYKKNYLKSSCLCVTCIARKEEKKKNQESSSKK